MRVRPAGARAAAEIVGGPAAQDHAARAEITAAVEVRIALVDRRDRDEGLQLSSRAPRYRSVYDGVQVAGGVDRTGGQ